MAYQGEKSFKSKRPQTKGSKINQRKKDLEGIKKFAEINPNAAKKELLNFIAEHPEDMYGYFFLGTLEEKLGNLKEAYHAYTKVAFSNANNRYSAMSRLGDIERRKGNVQEAKVWFRKVVTESLNKENYATHMLARLECLNKNYQAAIDLLTKLPDQDLYTKLELVRALSLDGRLKEATTILKDMNPTTAEEINLVSLEKGKIARRQNDISSAKFHLNNVILSGIENEIYARTLHELAEIEYLEGNYEDAAIKCQKMLDISYDFDKCAHLLLARCQHKLGDYNKALQNYQEATKSKEYETRTGGYFGLGNLHFQKGDFTIALEYLRKSQGGDLKPAYDTLIILAAIYFKTEKYDETLKCIDLLKEHYPDVALKSGISPVEILISKKLNLPTQDRENYQTYGERQAIEYSSKEALSHIKQRHGNKSGIVSNFSKDINIVALFDEIKLQMTEDTKVNENPMDIYEIDYKEVGYDQNGNLVDRIKVIALPGTFDILTMYPSDKGETIRQKDIKEKLEQEQLKPKVHSRIERFNNRFQIPTAK